jgi:hypothetical protein
MLLRVAKIRPDFGRDTGSVRKVITGWFLRLVRYFFLAMPALRLLPEVTATSRHPPRHVRAERPCRSSRLDARFFMI